MKLSFFLAMMIALIPLVDSHDQLAPGESLTYTRNYTVKVADLCAGWINNTANASGFDYCDKTVNASKDAEWSIRTEYHPAASLKKDSDKDGKQVNVGDIITYTYSVGNIGDVNLTIDSIVDDMLGPIDIESPSGDSNSDGWLNLNEVWTFTAYYDVHEDDLCSKIANWATLNAHDPCKEPIIPVQAYAEVETVCNELICTCCDSGTNWDGIDIGNQKALGLHNSEAKNRVNIIADQKGGRDCRAKNGAKIITNQREEN